MNINEFMIKVTQATSKAQINTIVDQFVNDVTSNTEISDKDKLKLIREVLKIKKDYGLIIDHPSYSLDDIKKIGLSLSSKKHKKTSLVPGRKKACYNLTINYGVFFADNTFKLLETLPNRHLNVFKADSILSKKMLYSKPNNYYYTYIAAVEIAINTFLRDNPDFIKEVFGKQKSL